MLQAYAIDRDASRIFVVTHRAGLLSFLGHDHAILPRDWSASLCLDDPIPAGAYGSFLIRTASLDIDSDSARTLAALGDGPGEDDRAAIRETMLDPRHLAADRFPEIRVDIAALEPDSRGPLRTRARLTLRGITRPFDLAVDAQRWGDRGLWLTGALTVRQRDFGIEPESIGGVVKVADPVELHFRLAVLPAGRPCDPTLPPTPVKPRPAT